MVTKTKKKSTTKKNLVIVESPAKAKTIEKYLGRNYKVLASVGHIRDLKKSTMSIDFENNYEPQYINIRGKGPLINDLKKEAKKAKQVFLASDPDREGEAISWHLAHILNLDEKEKNRVVFNEITKDAVKTLLKSRVRLIWIWSMPSRLDEFWTAWLVIPFLLFSGRKSKRAYQLAGCSLLRLS